MEESLYNRLLRSVLIGAVAVVILIGALFVLDRMFPGKIMRNNPSVPHVLPTMVPASKNNTTILIQKTGFSPVELRVNPGATINFANFSGEPVRMVGDNYASLSIGIVLPGTASDDVLFPAKGIFKYHNGLNPKMEGTIVVE